MEGRRKKDVERTMEKYTPRERKEKDRESVTNKGREKRSKIGRVREVEGEK